jgi:hypothetical protein
MAANMTEEEMKHVKLAQDNNGTYANFISKYGDKPIEQVSNADPGSNALERKFRGPAQDRYVFDPMNPGKVIDMQHFLACAQIPGGFGATVGLAVEVQQFFKGYKSAFLEEDLRSNRLGTLFGDYYLNDSQKGTTLGQKLQSFFQDYQSQELHIRRGGHDYINPFRIYSSIPENQSSVIARTPNESQLNIANTQNRQSSTSTQTSSAADRIREKIVALQAQNIGADSNQTSGNSSANGTATLSDRTDKLIAELDSMNPSNASTDRSQQTQPSQQIERG